MVHSLVGPNVLLFLQVVPPIVGILLFFAPWPDAQRTIQRRTTGGQPPLPFFAMLSSGVLWTCYGITAGWDLTVIVPNAVAILMGAYYVTLFCRYNSGVYDVRPYRQGVAATTVAVLATVVTQPEAKAQRMLGLAGCFVSFAMFGGPLQAITSVLRQRSTRDLSFPMACATTVNCGLWVCYCALVTHDPFGWIPNGLGLASGMAQLGLFLRFGFHHDADEHSTNSKGDAAATAMAAKTPSAATYVAAGKTQEAAVAALRVTMNAHKGKAAAAGAAAAPLKGTAELHRRRSRSHTRTRTRSKSPARKRKS